MSHRLIRIQPARSRHVPRRPPTHTAAAVSRQHHRTARRRLHPRHGGRQVRIGPVAFWIVVGIAGGHGRLVVRHRHLFRLPRRRAHAPDRPPGRDAIRLRGPHRRIARAGRPHHQPAAARPGAVRAEARAPCCNARRRWRAAPARSAASVTDRLDQPARTRPPPTRRRQAARPSPISDTVIFVAPPDREARLAIARSAGARRRASPARGEAPASKACSRASRAALDKVEQRQTAVLADMEERFDGKARRMRGVLDDLGVDPARCACRRRSAARSCR